MQKAVCLNFKTYRRTILPAIFATWDSLKTCDCQKILHTYTLKIRIAIQISQTSIWNFTTCLQNGSSAMKNFSTTTSIAVFDRGKAAPRDGEISEGMIFMRAQYSREINKGSSEKKKSFSTCTAEVHESNVTCTV